MQLVSRLARILHPGTTPGLAVLFCLVFAVLLWQHLNSANPATFHFDGASHNAIEHTLLPGAEEIELRLPKTGYTELILLRLSASNAFVVSRASEGLDAKSSRYDASHQRCHAREDGWLDCDIPFSKGNVEQILRIAATNNEPLQINNTNVQYLKSKRVPAGDYGHWPILAALLGLLLPLIWLVHSRKVLSQWVLAGSGFTILFALLPSFALLLTAFLFAQYKAGIAMAKATQKSQWSLLSLILASVFFLFVFKYWQDDLFAVFANLGNFNLALPLGLSYFVIRLIDTQMRWYRGELIDVSFREYLTFIIFPATIPAGPIESLPSFLDNRLSRIQLDDIAWGLMRITLGLFKKIVIADFLLSGALYGLESGLIFEVAIDPQQTSAPLLLAMLFGNFLFAYIDFSAYSDIAIGLSRMLGYRIMENFTWPILAANLRDYWRCWHRSLSIWCMRNIYFPLTVSTRNPYLPLYVVMMTVGLWHSFDLSWFSWALHHGTGLLIYTWFEKKKILRNKPRVLSALRPLRIVLTIGFVSAGHSFVLLSDYNTALQVYLRFWSMFIPGI